MVSAALAGPVSNSFLCHFLDLLSEIVQAQLLGWAVFWIESGLLLKESLGFFELFSLVQPLLFIFKSLKCGLFFFSPEHVLRSPNSVLHSSWLLASVTLFTPLEVVVLAFGTLPSTIGEGKAISIELKLAPLFVISFHVFAGCCFHSILDNIIFGDLILRYFSVLIIGQSINKV